ncbi:MAG TPA: phage head closure protein [Epulopiscium sp.]|nr:phage head closure protein [Candidatus Epulonipiscium sp.]
MKIAELNTKIDFMVEVAQDGPFEDLEPSYDPTITNIWAKRVKLLGKENIALGAEHNIIQVNFIIRYRSDINETVFIRHEDVIYNIVGYEELKDNRDYMLIATIKKQVIL